MHVLCTKLYACTMHNHSATVHEYILHSHCTPCTTIVPLYTVHSTLCTVHGCERPCSDLQDTAVQPTAWYFDTFHSLIMQVMTVQTLWFMSLLCIRNCLLRYHLSKCIWDNLSLYGKDARLTDIHLMSSLELVSSPFHMGSSTLLFLFMFQVNSL